MAKQMLSNLLSNRASRRLANIQQNGTPYPQLLTTFVTPETQVTTFRGQPSTYVPRGRVDERCGSVPAEVRR